MTSHSQTLENTPTGESPYTELVKTVFIAILIALTIRSLAYEPFSIPSSSMEPTLLVGDYLFVSKYSYGYSQYSFPLGIFPIPGRILYKQPARGDVAVFKKPGNVSIDYIKRIIGLPGDVVQVQDGILSINGEVAARFPDGKYTMDDPFTGRPILMQQYLEHLPNDVEHMIIERSDEEALDNTPLYTVPAGHVFVMGDNRDGSQDSRVMSEVGFVPVENLVGRAERLFFSIDKGTPPWHIWKWPWDVRFGRLFQRVSPAPQGE